MELYKLHVKLGESEFNAEGSQEIVQKAFEKFISVTEKIPLVKTTPKPTEGHKDNPKEEKIDQLILQRAFNADVKQGVVSLRALPAAGPNRASETALMILYGVQNLLHMSEVPVTRLKKGLTQSGIQVERVDWIMAPNSHEIIKGGSGVGGKYSLNNQGRAKAEELLRKIFS